MISGENEGRHMGQHEPRIEERTGLRRGGLGFRAYDAVILDVSTLAPNLVTPTTVLVEGAPGVNVKTA